jgi:hypothetical protein
MYLRAGTQAASPFSPGLAALPSFSNHCPDSRGQVFSHKLENNQKRQLAHQPEGADTPLPVPSPSPICPGTGTGPPSPSPICPMTRTRPTRLCSGALVPVAP